MPKVFPEILRWRRLALGLSQRAVADAVGVSETTINHWEHGKHRPRAKYMSALGRLLVLPEDQLKAEAPLSVDTLAPMTFDLPGFLAKLDDLIFTADQVRSDLRALQGPWPDDGPRKGAKRKKMKTKRTR